MTARAAMDAARAVFESVIGRPLTPTTGAPAFVEQDAALETPRGRAEAMQRHAEAVLQAVVGRLELTGQALVGEARRQQRLSPSDAHALVALQGWCDRVQDRTAADPFATAATDEDERAIAREAWRALENAMDRPVAAAPVATAPVAPMPESSMSNASNATPGASSRRWYTSSAAILAAVLIVVGGGIGGYFLYRYSAQQDYRDGLGAYERGARDVARVAFARAAQRHPDDARPLVFLGRLAREDNDLSRARRFLETAVALDPGNATAQRELAAALLADGQPELARRFYVRAIELKSRRPALAEGFLACALHRLGRVDEARRWADRAGSGDWMPCLRLPPGAPQRVSRLLPLRHDDRSHRRPPTCPAPRDRT